MMNELTHFFWMGGYAFYIWSAYGLVFLILAINLIWTIRKEKIIVKEIKQIKIETPPAANITLNKYASST